MNPVDFDRKKRVLFYCQHLLGMGHLIRSLAILEKLKDFEVRFINGGEVVADVEVPSFVQVVNLPPLHSKPDFKGLHTASDSAGLDTVKEIRRRQLLEEFERFHPHALVIELFPFGRKQFAFELIPVLARNRLNGKPTTVVCSLRDILVSKSDPVRHEERCARFVNRYFDAVLIHSDPAFQILDETFSRTADLTCPIRYTGFVAREVAPAQSHAGEPCSVGDPETPLILVSVGGGRVGYELVASAIQASSVLYAMLPHRLLVFTGPYMPETQIESLRQLSGDRTHVMLRRYTTEFPSLLEKADLSISMAGYNTCMDILTTGVRALVLPFIAQGNDEQTMRAQKLERHGVVTVLDPVDLEPHALSQKMASLLRSAPPSPTVSLDTNGAQQTAALIAELLTDHDTPGSPNSGRPASVHTPPWRQKLEAFLEQQREAGSETIHFFLRDDDVNEDEESLRRLLDITVSRWIPVNLEIIPGRLTESGIKLLDAYARSLPGLFELHQHGWQHVNHEPEGKKCEFGPSRPFHEQLDDIRRGKELLDRVFKGLVYPAFTPPWNRCTPDTYKALDDVGILVLSKDHAAQPITGYRFRELSTTLDLYRWKDGPAMKTPDEIVTVLIQQLADGLSPIGLLLHHKVMNDAAFPFLDDLLDVLAASPLIRFHSFHSLMAALERQELQPQGVRP